MQILTDESFVKAACDGKLCFRRFHKFRGTKHCTRSAKGVHEAFQQKINNNNQSHKSTILLIQRYSYEMFQL